MRSVRRLAVAAAALAIVVPMVLVLASPSGADTLTNGSASLTTNGTITAGTPYSSGQSINVAVSPNSTLSLTNLESNGYSGEPKIDVLECADPDGTTANLPSRENQECDGQTLSSTTNINSDGSFKVNDYPVYALPDVTTFGESATGVPDCGDTAATECVLFIGPDPGSFAEPHLFSAPFSVLANGSDNGASPGDGQLAPLTAQTITFTSSAPAPGVVGGTYTPAAIGGGSGNPVTFSIAASSTEGACTLAGGTVSLTGAGTCVIDGNEASNDVNGVDYAPATQASQSFPVTTANGVAITTTSLPSATQGGLYSFTLTAEGGQLPYKWRVTGLPKGLKGSKAGVIAGTPKTKHVAPGLYTITVTVATKKFKVGSGHSKMTIPSMTATKTFTLTLNAAP